MNICRHYCFSVVAVALVFSVEYGKNIRWKWILGTCSGYQFHEDGMAQIPPSLRGFTSNFPPWNVEQQFSIILFHSTEKFPHESPRKTDNIAFSWGEIDKWMCNNLLPPILWLQLQIATFQIRNSKQLGWKSHYLYERTDVHP